MDTVTPPLEVSSRPALARHVRLSLDTTRSRHVLLSPETVAVLNATSADILRLCDGRRTVGEIAAELERSYDRVAEDEIRAFLQRLADKQWVEIDHG